MKQKIQISQFKNRLFCFRNKGFIALVKRETKKQKVNGLVSTSN